MTRGRRASGSRRAGSGRRSLQMAVSMQDLINDLEVDAYLGVLQAFAAQSDDISWAKEGLLSELRRELRIPDETHRELVTKISRNETWESIRESRKNAELRSALLYEAPTSSPVFNSHLTRKRKESHMNLSLPPPVLSKLASSSLVFLQAGSAGRRNSCSKVTSVQPMVMSRSTGAVSGVSGRGHRGRSSVSSKSRNESGGFSEKSQVVGRHIQVRSWDDGILYDAVVKDYDPQRRLHYINYNMGVETLSRWEDLQGMDEKDVEWKDPISPIPQQRTHFGSHVGRGGGRGGRRGGRSRISARVVKKAFLEGSDGSPSADGREGYISVNDDED